MTVLKKIKAGLVKVPAETYIGEEGSLFYNYYTGTLRLSDGKTPGGVPIYIAYATSEQAGAIIPGAGFSVSTGGVLTLNAGPMFELDGSNVFQLKPGTSNRIGGVKAGTGVVINSEGEILIDSQGLQFSFGDFSGTVGHYTDETAYALLSSVNENEDIVIASNGLGGIKVVGDFEIYATNGTVTGSLEEEEPYFRVKNDGQVRILVPAEDLLEGGIEIVGSLTGTYVPPGQIGSMLHLTGNPNVPCRVYHDTLGEYSSYVFRRYNGTVASPTAVLANQDVARINFTASTSSGLGNMALAQIRVTSLENQTNTAQGSKITFTVTPIGADATNRVDVATITTADGITATKFTGPLVGNVTGNITGTAPAGTLTGTALASNVVASSLTTVGTLTNLDIATGGTITTPRIVINAGGIRTVNGGTTLTINFSTDTMILWTAPTGTATVSLSNYTAGAQVKLIIALTTTRDINFGVASNANSSTGVDNWNGSGPGSSDITNTAVHLDYTCFTGLAAGCYVAVTAN